MASGRMAVLARVAKAALAPGPASPAACCSASACAGRSMTTYMAADAGGKTQYADLAGYPKEMYEDRKVVIYSPAKNAMQSGVGKLGKWKMMVDKRDRWENPLMGWSSTADPLNHVFRYIKFDAVEDAIAFAEKHGFEYVIEERKMKAKMKAKSYSAKVRRARPSQRSRTHRGVGADPRCVLRPPATTVPLPEQEGDPPRAGLHGRSVQEGRGRPRLQELAGGRSM